MRANLFETSKLMPSSVSFYNSEFLKGCHPSKAYKAKMTGQEQVASFCSLNYVWPMIAHDFSMTGKCNFYLMDEKVLDYPVGAAFQVSTIENLHKYMHDIRIGFI